MGAATILENITDGVAREWVRKALVGDFLTRDNTKFLVLDQHEVLLHGDQILEAIETAGLEPQHFRDLIEGARRGTVLYLRMAERAINPDGLASICDRDAGLFDAHEDKRIEDFSMDELQHAVA